jgi:hypothetical protein
MRYITETICFFGLTTWVCIYYFTNAMGILMNSISSPKLPNSPEAEVNNVKMTPSPYSRIHSFFPTEPFFDFEALRILATCPVSGCEPAEFMTAVAAIKPGIKILGTQHEPTPPHSQNL